MRRWRVGLVSVALLAASRPAVPATAFAASEPVVTTAVAMSGVPAHVSAGGTLSFTLTFSQQSQYRLYLDGLAFEVWNRCLCPPDDSSGTTATFLDPSSGTWRTTPGASGDSYELGLRQGLLVAPGQTVSIPVRLAIGGFRSGSYALADNGTQVGDAINGQGNPVPFTWRISEAGDRYFTIGTGSAITPPSSHAPVAPQPEAPWTQAAQASSAAAVPSARPSVAAAVTATPIRSVPTAASPGSRAPAALVRTAGVPGEPVARLWWLAVVVLLSAAVGSYALQHRRRDRTTTPAAAAGDTADNGGDRQPSS